MNIYAIAVNLVGFKCENIRVKVLRTYFDGTRLVVTADLLDCGTVLALPHNQLRDEWDTDLLYDGGPAK